MVIEYVGTVLGAEAVEELLQRSAPQRSMADLLNDASWFTYDEFRRLLTAAAELLGGPDALVALGEVVSPAGGSMPELTMVLQAFGSPSKMWASMADGASGIYTVSRGGTQQVGPADWRLTTELLEGFEPFEELCNYLMANAVLGVRLFGMKPTAVFEEQCQRRGDPVCAIRIQWSESEDLNNQLAFLQTSLQLAEKSLDSFRALVGELVTTEELDTVLGRIVSSASRATRAPAYVLALEALPWRGRAVHAEGLSMSDAQDVADAVLRGDIPATAAHVVEVASRNRRYGYLVALSATNSVLGSDRANFELYASLAATALDSACALEESRRQARASRALLELSRALTDLTTPGGVGGKVVAAMQEVLDCDACAMLVAHEDIGHIAAHSGFAPEVVALLDSGQFQIGSRLDKVTTHTPETSSRFARRFMESVNIAAMASAPVIVDSEVVGYLLATVTENPARLLRDPELEERFSGLAAQASVALSNGRLLDRIRHQSLHDGLTGLPNRSLILDRAEQIVARAGRTGGAWAALFIDLDGFKDVNDSRGHATGDELLRHVAERIRHSVRDCDTVGRLGGDEFVVLVDGIDDDAEADVLAERILASLREPIAVDRADRSLTIDASIGVAIGGGDDAADVLRDADIALYQAKSSGKACVRRFSPEMKQRLLDRTALHEQLTVALSNDEYRLHYQPIVDLESGRMTGVEALLRWQHPDRGLVAPDAFIPLLEESGGIVEVGEWVLRAACEQAMQWHARGHDIGMAVNASVRQLERPDFVSKVHEALVGTGLAPSALTIEITETAVMRDAESMLAVIRGLKALGVRVAIDDFGTGYSSLAYLRELPVDTLKIDRSFIAAAADSDTARQLIHTLVQLGKALNLETLAEGIEDPGQLDRLRAEGCDTGQGYIFGRPVDAQTFETFLQTFVTIELR
jgi:diguanylate cyclase (GGDEF)-like protein